LGPDQPFKTYDSIDHHNAHSVVPYPFHPAVNRLLQLLGGGPDLMRGLGANQGFAQFCDVVPHIIHTIEDECSKAGAAD
jgi:hypothetical protein